MRQVDADSVSHDSSRLILMAVRPSARFHQLGGIGSLLLLYPARDPLAHQSRFDRFGNCRTEGESPGEAA